MEETRPLWEQLARRWAIQPDRPWYPHATGLPAGWWDPIALVQWPTGILIVELLPFIGAVPCEALVRVLAAHGIEQVWKLRLGRSRDQQRMDVSLLTIQPDVETVWTSEPYDRVLYVSHEDYLTIGGQWLQAEVQQLWPDWQNALWQPEQARREREQARAVRARRRPRR